MTTIQTESREPAQVHHGRYYREVFSRRYCNHTKSAKKITCSSHDYRFKTDELLTFDFHIKGMDFLSDKQQLGIEIYDKE